MALNICALLLVLAITFMNSIFGLFSGVINTFCAIVAAVVSLGYYEALNELVIRQISLSPSYSAPACLVILFILTLTLMRLAADRLIRGNVRVPMALDWAGGAVAGLVIGQICVGILLLGVMMLPLGGRVLQFQRFERDPDTVGKRGEYVEFTEHKIWLRSDQFVAGLVRILSNGSLRDKATFASVYPDFPKWVFWTSNTVQPESLTAPRAEGMGTKGLGVVEWWEQPGGVEGRYRSQLPTRDNKQPRRFVKRYTAAPGMKLIGVRLKLLRASADLVGKQAAYHRFRPSMIRLVGTVGDRARDYVARILRGADQNPNLKNALLIADIDTDFAVSASGETIIDAYFEVDEEFTPAFVEYRRYARAAVPRNPSERPPAGVPTVARAAAPAGRAARGGTGGTSEGAMAFLGELVRPYGDITKLPFDMSLARVRGAATVSGELFVSGRVYGDRERLKRTGGEPRLTDFKVPTGYRLCQARFKPRRPRSLAGQVFNYVAARANQYFAVDNDGSRHPLSGYFAIVPRGRTEYVELFFNGDPNEPANPAYNGMLDFKQIKLKELEGDDAVLCLLFLVPPGTTIRAIENQKGEGVRDIRIRARGGR